MAIKVIKEGRKGCYLISKEETVNLIKSIKGDEIHNFTGCGPMMFGCDWSKESVLKLLNDDSKGELRIALVFEPQTVMGHHLRVCNDSELNSFDVGKLNEVDLEILC